LGVYCNYLHHSAAERAALDKGNCTQTEVAEVYQHSHPAVDLQHGEHAASSTQDYSADSHLLQK